TVGVMVIFIGDPVSILFSQLRIEKWGGQVYRRVTPAIGHIVGKRPKGKGIFVDVTSVVDQRGDEVPASSVMQKIRKYLISQGLIAHILNPRSAISKPMRSLDFFRGCCRKTTLEQGAKIRVPHDVNHLFMGKNRKRKRRLKH